MKLVLKPFQEEARDNLLFDLSEARVGAIRKPQAISLTAPTGSGKTVIMTAVMEAVHTGDAQHGSAPDVTFLWLSDQPELNTQTLRKLLGVSTHFTTKDVEVIDQGFDQRVLDEGRIYFLNFQKLGKDKNLVSYGDKRTYTIWDTLRNTIQERPDRVVLILDEAHRGMIETAAERKSAQSIAQRFIKGDAQLPPVPLLIGVTATPKRFHDLLADANRVVRPISVSSADVRESGLLKDTIRVFYPVTSGDSELTILRKALASYRQFQAEWGSYCAEQRIDPIHPILTIQVEDGRDGRLSETNLEEVWRIIDEELGHLGPTAYAHAFQEGISVPFGSSTVRYLAPSDIQTDPDVRVVFFKTSLSTGWDCPRAEVMMSFRAARDATLIAQLVGRMVRTPLARAVPEREFLNTVSLYLPFFDRATVKRVVEGLTDPEADGFTAVDVEDASDLVDVSADVALNEARALVAHIPNYAIPRARSVSQIHRLNKLARLLARLGIDDDAVDGAKALLCASLERERGRMATDEVFKAALLKLGRVDLFERRHEVLAERPEDTETVVEAGSEPLSEEDVQNLFAESGRRLREGLHLDFLRASAKTWTDIRARKLEIAALANEPRVMAALQSDAQSEVERLLKHHAKAISKLDPEDQVRVDEVRALAPDPVQLPTWALPDAYSVRADEQVWEKHLFTTSEGKYPAGLNSWERKVLDAEMARPGFVAWFRNLDRKRWSLRVPYQVGTEWRPLYPDFLVIDRDEDGDLRVSIVDPHLGKLEDAVPKAIGLARYAERHARQFGRIDLVTVEKNVVRRLDLTDAPTRASVAAATSTQHLEALFQGRKS